MTGQAADRIWFDGKWRSFIGSPLDSAFCGARPKPAFAAVSSDNWRGFCASWLIEQDRLYLSSLNGTICLRTPDGSTGSSWCTIGHSGECAIKEITQADIFQEDTGPVHADWFSGEIDIVSDDPIEEPDQNLRKVLSLCRIIRLEFYMGILTQCAVLSDDESIQIGRLLWSRVTGRRISSYITTEEIPDSCNYRSWRNVWGLLS
jgi:hypothetical protein